MARSARRRPGPKPETSEVFKTSEVRLARRGASRPARRRKGGRRKGVSSLDYVIILGVILPMVAAIIGYGARAIRLTYEMVCVLVSWPFM